MPRKPWRPRSSRRSGPRSRSRASSDAGRRGGRYRRICRASASSLRRVASVGDIGWRLCEQFPAVQWGPVAFLVVAILVAVAAVSWIAVRRRQTVIGGAVLGS
jgi:hypothetical protein